MIPKGAREKEIGDEKEDIRRCDIRKMRRRRM
jgi:hypothetical protein